MLLLTKIVLFTGVLTVGDYSLADPPQSNAWPRSAILGGSERDATNGMAWPSHATSSETVMTPEMQIIALTPSGEIKIRAGRDFERFYTWDGATRSAKLWPRKQRWYGSLGIYYPGPGEHWKSNKGITRGVLEEGVLWFRTEDDALNWIRRARSTGIDYVFASNGLALGFCKIPARRQVNISVWQIMVAGKQPRSFPGGRDDLISIAKSQQ